MRMGVLLLAAILAAGESGADSFISETEFLERTARDERVRALLDEPLQISRAQRARAAAWPNPEGIYEREAPDESAPQETWSLAWAPPLDGRQGLRGRAARAGLTAAERRHEAARVDWRAEMRAAFADWASAHQAATVGEHLATLVDRLAVKAEARGARGEESGLATRRLLLVRAEIRAEAARRSAELLRAQAEVRAWMPDIPSDAAPEPPPLPPVPPTAPLGPGAPRLEALRHDVEQAEAAARFAGRFWALPELSFGWRTIRGQVDDVRGPVYGARWALPLFDRQQGERLETRARLSAARARHELEQARVRERVLAATAAYATLREATVTTAEAGRVTGRIIESAAARFEAGESEITELLETLRGVLSGQQAILGAHAAALRAHRELEVAAGRALPLIEGVER